MTQIDEEDGRARGWTCKSCDRQFDEAWRYNMHREIHTFTAEYEEEPDE